MTDITDVLQPNELYDKFEVRDLSAANWAAGKIVQANSKKAEIEAVAAEMHRKIDAWAEDAKKTHDTGYLEEMLREWTYNEIQGEKRRSVKLFGATAGFRKSPDRVDVLDENQAIEYCTAYHPDLVREKVTYSLDKKMVKDTGEIIPGVEIHPGVEKFYITED